MSLEFKPFKQELENYFKEMCKENEHLFEVDLDKDQLWNIYLDTIPVEDNKIFKVRREFDCSCCRHFVKAIGNIVAIKNGKLVSIWDFDSKDPKWSNVAKAMSDYVKQYSVTNVYISKFSSVGTDYNMMGTGDGKAIRWDHFYLKLPESLVFAGRYGDTINSKRGEYRDIRNVFKRSLDELTEDSVLTVLDLVNQGSLYKGDEYKHILTKFKNLKKDYDKLDDYSKELFAWDMSLKIDQATAKIRNTAIGTLLIDVSNNVDLEEAVCKYESVTAPQNYKRSKPIFTKKMLEDAQKTITDLGYLDSLERRYANAAH